MWTELLQARVGVMVPNLDDSERAISCDHGTLQMETVQTLMLALEFVCTPHSQDVFSDTRTLGMH
eukprot:6187062-Amphidinium_carterae.1